MTYPIQDAAGTIFNAAKVPEELIEPLKVYVQIITTSLKIGETFSLEMFNRIWKLVDRQPPLCLAVEVESLDYRNFDFPYLKKDSFQLLDDLILP